MKLSRVWSPYDAKQLGEEAGCPPKPILPTGEDPIKTSIDSLTLPIVYTPISSIKPQPGSTIQSQGTEAIYSLLSLIDDMAESLVGKDKWRFICEEEQGKLNATAQSPDKRLPVLLPVSTTTNKELSLGVTKFFRQVDVVTNTISRTQLNLQQHTPIDHGSEIETEYRRFTTDTGADPLSVFLRSALRTLDSLPEYQAGAPENPGCVLCIPDDRVVFDKAQNMYRLTARDAATLNSLLIPGDIVRMRGQYYVLSLSFHNHSLLEPIKKQEYVVAPCPIANLNSVHADASIKLERQMQGSRWRDEPLLKKLDNCPIFCCFTQCISARSAMSFGRDICVIASFFKGHPHELGQFPLSAPQIVKYLAFYDPKDTALRFFIFNGPHKALPGAGTKDIFSEKRSEDARKLIGNRADSDIVGSSDAAFSDTETSTLSSLTSDYILEADTGNCGREANEFFSKHDIDEYSFINDQESFPPNSSLNSSALLEVVKSLQASNDSQQAFFSNFHTALQSISYGISLMYEAPMSISEKYIAWIDALSESSTEILYLYDRFAASKRPVLTLNLCKFLSHYLKKNFNKSKEHLNGITCMPIVQDVHVIELPCNHVLMILVPYMSGSFFFCSFKREEVPSTAEICIVAQKSVIDVINTDLLQTYGLFFVSTRTFVTDSHNKIKASTHLHVFSLIYSYKEVGQKDLSARSAAFKEPSFTVLFKPVHTLFLMDSGCPAKGIALLDSMRLAVYFESLSYFYIVDAKPLQGGENQECNAASTCCLPITPIYTACRSISTLLYNHDGEHIILFEHGETQAFVYSLNNLKEPRYSIILPGEDRINHAAPGGDSGLIALSGDHTVSIYRLGASEIFLKHYVTRGRAIGIAWSTPTSLLVVTEQVLHTITIGV